MKDKFNIKNYEYKIPKSLIAQKPPTKRGSSKLMAVDKSSGKIFHKKFSEITEFLNPGDCLVLNDTKVMPARLYGKTKKTGAKIEILFLKNIKKTIWEVMMKNSRRVKNNDAITFPKNKDFILLEKKGKTALIDTKTNSKSLKKYLMKNGVMPLPPYIREDTQNKLHKKRYQTVYAQKEGANAAPTAGLHFTPKILEKLEKNEVTIARVTLHVGFGTFESINKEDIRKHKIHSEYMEITPKTADKINACSAKGKRIFAAGTTALRAIETAADKNGTIKPFKGETSIYIYPGYRFKAASGLITNFHLPRTTLLALVYAFGGEKNIKKAYKEAIKNKYRFFSYGDAMVIY